MPKIRWSEIDPHELEFLIAECFSRLGYMIVQTKLTVDGGVDVIADRFDEVTRSWIRFVIQVKRHSKSIGVGKVRELNGVLDDFKAVKGILIATGGFSKGAKDFERSHIERISLWGARSLMKLLRNADLIDSEGNLRKPSDPNLKSNRWTLICMTLRAARARNTMNPEEVVEALRRQHKVTVPINVIEGDLAELSERGDVIRFGDGQYYARILEAEIEDICSKLAKEIPQWDFHFDEDDLADYVVKNYKISPQYVEEYMHDNLSGILNELKRIGLLIPVGNRYFTEQGLENFRKIRQTKKQMRENLIDFLGISDDDMERTVASLFTMNQAFDLLDKENPRKKICAFKQVMPFKCVECGTFSFEAMEFLSLIVVPSSLKPEPIKVKMPHGIYESLKPEDVVEIFKCSSLYVERLKELIDDYEIGKDGFSAFAFGPYDVLLIIDLNLKEKSTLKEMIDSIVRESLRFQNFLTDLNQSIPSYGFPRQVISLLVKDMTPVEETHKK